MQPFVKGCALLGRALCLRHSASVGNLRVNSRLVCVFDIGEKTLQVASEVLHFLRGKTI